MAEYHSLSERYQVASCQCLFIATTSSEVHQNFEGTLLYAAPEVLQRKPFDYRIDIYTLAVTAFAMLTDKTLFRAPPSSASLRSRSTRKRLISEPRFLMYPMVLLNS